MNNMKNFERLYRDYVIKYNKEIAKADAKNEPVFDREMLTKLEFQTMFAATQNDMAKMGRTVTDKKTIDALVDRSIYSRSLAQGIELKKAAARRGIEMTVHEARVWGGLEEIDGAPANVSQFFNDIKITRNNLKAQGLSNSEIAKFIAIEFFGS